MKEREMEKSNRRLVLHSVPPRNPAELRPPRSRNPRTAVPVPRRNLAKPRPRPRNTPTAIHVQHLRRPVGIDLICNGCQHHVPGSQELWISYRFYSGFGYRGYPVMCFAYCLNCCDEWMLIPKANTFAVYSGATQHFPAEENIPSKSDDGPLILWRELRR